MKSGPVAYAVTAAAIVAGPVLYGARKVQRWWNIKHLPTHVLHGPDGMEAHISPLGAVIQRLIVPDANGVLADVVLGFDAMEPYAVRSTFYPSSLRGTFWFKHSVSVQSVNVS